MKSEAHAGSPPHPPQTKLPEVKIGAGPRLQTLLNAPVNGASLGIFRIAVGLIMALEAWVLCLPSASFNGKIPLQIFYTGADVKFHFIYPGFHWLPVFSSHGFEVVVALQAISGVLLALGLASRLSSLVLFLCWGYLFAIESTRTYWQSYHYLELLTTFLLVWMPAGRRFSLDAWIARRWRRPRPGSRQKTPPSAGRLPPAATTVPFWTLFLLRGQLLIAYFYGGVAKLTADWLLDAQPVKYFLVQARWLHDYGTHLSPGHLAFFKRFLQSNELAYFFSWTGAAFDLSVGFLLLFRRTRIFGMVLMFIFHTTNHFVLFENIDLFPLLGFLTATIFLDPDWPERFWRWIQHPRLSKPDWGWLVGGAVLFPLVGAALGWKLRPTSPALSGRDSGVGFQLGRRAFVVISVCAWLLWQGLVPTRRYLVGADTRFTWEGLSFSWRLKADLYRSTPCNLYLEDTDLISQDQAGRCRIDWGRWRGDKVLYRRLVPGRVDWSRLPEIFVLVEPLVGQRILYNPFAGAPSGRTETQCRARVRDIWQELYHRQPQVVLRTASATETLSACAPTLRTRGYPAKTTVEVKAELEELFAKGEEHELASIMRQTHPLALQGAGDPPVPFLLIEDASLAHNPGTAQMRVELTRWHDSAYSRSPQDATRIDLGGQPLIIYTSTEPFELREGLPEAAIFDSQEHPEQAPRVWWNYLRELTYAQGTHVSLQPFLLREYARHIADRWQQTYGRRPKVFADTAVSLNFRPPQALVDPSADLASVGAAHFRHNAWIKDLECPRIPR